MRQSETVIGLWKIADVAAYLKIHPHTVYKMAEADRIPAFKVGSHWRFSPPVIEQWCQRLQDEQAEQANARHTQSGGD